MLLTNLTCPFFSLCVLLLKHCGLEELVKIIFECFLDFGYFVTSLVAKISNILEDNFRIDKNFGFRIEKDFIMHSCLYISPVCLPSLHLI
jgi:hypothetical protein